MPDILRHGHVEEPGGDPWRTAGADGGGQSAGHRRPRRPHRRLEQEPGRCP